MSKSRPVTVDLSCSGAVFCWIWVCGNLLEEGERVCLCVQPCKAEYESAIEERRTNYAAMIGPLSLKK